MTLKKLLAIATISAALVPAAFAQQAPKPTFVILGSFHFQGSTADLLSNSLADVQSEKRQKEMEAIVEALARFRPTKIAVEYPVGHARIQEAYQAYLKGERKLGDGEAEQLGFRLARRLGHDRIHPVDHKLDMDFDAIMKAVEKYGQKDTFERGFGMAKEMVGETQRLVETGPVAGALRYMNGPALLDSGHGLYLLTAQIGGPGDPVGAQVVAGWYERNLLIYSNLVRLIESPGERVLLVIGAGHAKLLRDYIAQSPNLLLEEAVDYLP